MSENCKVVAIIQARMGSSRLPGKILLDLAGEPMLVRVVNRVCRAQTVDEVVIATTTEPADQAIAVLCADRGWPCFRGSEEDVLDRYYQAARAHGAEVVVRITSDCPLIEPEVIDRIVGEYLDRRPTVQYASNFLPRRTFPRGLDVEILGSDLLQWLWQQDQNPASREHVTEYVCQHHEQFNIHCVVNEADLSALRWTVDTSEDFELIRRIYQHFRNDGFSWAEVLLLLESNPQWLDLNRHVQQKVIH